MLRRLVLELRHAAEITERAETGEHPSHLRVCTHVALDKDETLLRIKSAREQEGKRRAACLSPHRRLVIDGERMEIGDEVVAVVFLLQLAPVFHRAEIVAEGECAGGLNAAQDDPAAGWIVFVHGYSFLIHIESLSLYLMRER